jgi:DNA-binding beta-propeller fold protein YncE
VRYLLASILASAPLVAVHGQGAAGTTAQPLRLESRIPLGSIRGRIDHLAVDLGRQRLFVAELGNDSVGVLDLKNGRTERTLTGLHEPQGVGYVPSTDSVYVANGDDGSVRVFRGENLVPSGEIGLGDDADNVRVDDAARRVFVGYGSGALAEIDAVRVVKVGDTALEAHPESFRLAASGGVIFVNVPNAGEIAVVDRRTQRQVASWRTGTLRANFPLAIDETGRVISVFRHPAKVAIYRPADGYLLAAMDTCGDSDDLFVDSKRRRVYVICGEGAIDVLGARGAGYVALARIPTVPGARTGLFVPELNRLFLAARARMGTPAAVWVYQPVP